MIRRIRIIGGVLLGCALLGLLVWALVPRYRLATEAEVRAVVDPALLLPLPQPAGGVERRAALGEALDSLSGKSFDVDDPVVLRVLDLLKAGALDRAAEDPYPDPRKKQPFTEFTNRLVTAAQAAAQRDDWVTVRRTMDAIHLLQDRVIESNVTLEWAMRDMGQELRVYRAILELAARRDLPASLLESLSAQVARERHGPDWVRQVLRGEVQLVILKEVPQFHFPYWWGNPDGGRYDALATGRLFSDLCMEVLGNVSRPPSDWQDRAASGIDARVSQLHEGAWPAEPEFWHGPYVAYLDLRIMLRTSTYANSVGVMAAYDKLPGNLLQQVLRVRSRREQLAAALAVQRYRRQTGRDPVSFDELVAVGLLQGPPIDHARERPLDFDLEALYQWPQPKPVRLGY